MKLLNSIKLFAVNMKSSNLYILILIFISTTLIGQNPISHVAFEGNKKTKRAYLMRNILCERGLTYDSLTLEKDIKSLWNTQLFGDVKSHVRIENDSVLITFTVKEKVSIMPIVGGNLFGDNFNVKIGVADYNFLGKAQELSFIYQYYDRHSFFLNYDIPFIAYSKWGAGLSLSKKSTREPLYFGNSTPIDYNYDLFNYELRGKYTFNQNHFVQIAGAYLQENYDLIDKELNKEDINYPNSLKLNKQLLKLFYKRDKINYFYHYLQGWKFSIINDYVYTPKINTWFWKAETSINYYKRIGKKSNWATRLVLGVAKYENSPFQPFVLDNYINLRGIGNRTKRGNTTCTINTEYRYSLFENKKWALQGVSFIDFGTVNQGELDIKKFFDNGEVFGGLGLRIYSNQFFNFLIRLDYGINLNNPSNNNFIIGIGQFF